MDDRKWRTFRRMRRSLRWLAAGAVLFIVVLSGLAGGCASGSKAEGDHFDRAAAEEIVRLVNEERTKRGLGQVTLDETMMSAAEVRAKEQQASFSHTRPDGSDAFTIFAQFEIPANYRGENLACGGNASPQAVMQLWMSSEGHYANIVNPRFTRIGVGAFSSGKYGYWCQLFAN